MKHVFKGKEPATLSAYRTKLPNSSWDQMKREAPQAYQGCRLQLIYDQHGLCAYCEIDIRDNDPLKCQIEHFYPQAASSTNHNWALDWRNLLAVCNGGTRKENQDIGFYLEPTDQNLSCDAHKNRMIQTNRLPERCDGWILNPLQLAVTSSLFRLEMSTGRLLPDAVACEASQPWPNNQYASIEALVQHSIDAFNLNCDRLTQARLRVIRDIERNKKRQREQGFNSHDGLANLARRYFRIVWPGFFTTIRLCLGAGAESHLQAVNFQG